MQANRRRNDGVFVQWLWDKDGFADLDFSGQQIASDGFRYMLYNITVAASTLTTLAGVAAWQFVLSASVGSSKDIQTVVCASTSLNRLISCFDQQRANHPTHQKTRRWMLRP